MWTQMDALVTGERDPRAELAFEMQSSPLLPVFPCLCPFCVYLLFAVAKPDLASAVPGLTPGLCLLWADLVERSAWLVLASVSCPRFFLGSLQPPFFLAFTIYI